MIKQQEEEAARRLAEKLRKQKIGGYSDDDDEFEDKTYESNESNNEYQENGMEEFQPDNFNQKQESTVRKFRGIPEDVKLFEVFWGQIVDLIKVLIKIVHSENFNLKINNEIIR